MDEWIAVCVSVHVRACIRARARMCVYDVDMCTVLISPFFGCLMAWRHCLEKAKRIFAQ